MIPFVGIREIPPGSFRKATLSHKTSGSSLFLQIQPSPVEMEHVSTTPDIAKSGPWRTVAWTTRKPLSGVIEGQLGLPGGRSPGASPNVTSRVSLGLTVTSADRI